MDDLEWLEDSVRDRLLSDFGSLVDEEVEGFLSEYKNQLREFLTDNPHSNPNSFHYDLGVKVRLSPISGGHEVQTVLSYKGPTIKASACSKLDDPRQLELPEGGEG